MAEGWVVLELTPKGEKTDPTTVQKDITRTIPGAEIYIPAVETQVGDDQVIHYLMNGYAFVRETSPPRPLRQYRRLSNTKYVNTVLQQRGRVAPVADSYIEDMKEKMRAEVNQGIGVGDIVEIRSGPYKNIEASVVVELPETKEVQIFVQLRSKQTLLTLPRSVLRVVDRAPLSPYFARIGYLRAWASMARVLLSYDTPIDRLHKTMQQYENVVRWMEEGSKLVSYIHSENGALDKGLQEINNKIDQLEGLEGWLNKGNSLHSFIFFERDMPIQRLSDVTSKYLQVTWLDSVEKRVLGLSRDVEGLARELAYARKKDDSMTIQNVLVDGNNLAHRCFHAPGMNALKSKDGRRTGVIVGFLRSLGSLRKRFPEAKFWVAWDGSSERRRRVYHDYKANRKTAKFPDQEKFLREVLPFLGVRQVWNPKEEADDIIGTMVRGPLQNEKNLIFSTDKDFLQLVTEDTLALTPAIGSRKEILYDPEKVEAAFGVPPRKMVQLRAFFGDTSDNLPGVPRVPKKVLKALLSAHGSIQGVYDSGLAGMSKGQYERLRTAEAQVKLNLDVMALVDVEVTQVDADVDTEKSAKRLRGLDVDPSPIMNAFFGRG